MARHFATIQNKTANLDRQHGCGSTGCARINCCQRPTHVFFPVWSRQATKGMVSYLCHSVGESRSRNCSAIQSMNTRTIANQSHPCFGTTDARSGWRAPVSSRYRCITGDGVGCSVIPHPKRPRHAVDRLPRASTPGLRRNAWSFRLHLQSSIRRPQIGALETGDTRTKSRDLLKRIVVVLAR
jgi:hypothetical protein